MEHSALHGLQLCGLITVLGGVFLVLAILRPSARAAGSAKASLAAAWDERIARGVFLGALVAAAAGLLDLFVQVAEVQGRTLLGGIDFPLMFRFATETSVGRLELGRIGSLGIVALLARAMKPARWGWIALAGIVALACASLVSHAAAQPVGRNSAILAQWIHMGAGSVWIGTLIHLLRSRRWMESPEGAGNVAFIADMVRRFSPLALTTAVLLAGSGLFSLIRCLATPADTLTSAYGLTLLVKLTLLVPVLVAGCVNYRVIRPELTRLASGTTVPEAKVDVLRRFGRMLELEVTAGVLVITVAGILGSISPPGEDGTYQLTNPQVRALASPDWPTTAIANPETFYGAGTRGINDLRYSEFTHNWSGVFVTLLGLLWLVQSLGGSSSSGRKAGAAWPFLLVPFALFVAIAADPEVWWLRRVSFWQALSDPALLEHQLGALLVLLLIWFGWRDRHRSEDRRPLGFVLPVIMILGSLLLLGHAHSALTVTEELTNLINVQHAIFGAFGLWAGTVRWLSLRALIPATPARVIWPGLIIALGLFMAFGYREVV